MTDTQLLKTIDARAWANEFVRIKNDKGWTLDEIDEDLMLCWFANAMCAQMDFDAKESK